MHTISELRDRAEMLTPPLPWDRPRWHDQRGPAVVLLHGLWRSRRAMQPLARTLEKNGFSTLNIPYPSSRLPIDVLTSRIRTQLSVLPEDRPVHFITHSLGGIIARSLLSSEIPWQVGKVIMLAPPSNGSEIVDWSKKHPLIHYVLGPAGRDLGSDGAPYHLPVFPPHIDAAAIMGKRNSIPVFKKILGTENDGIVSAEKGRIAGLKGFSVIDADHTFIQIHPDTIRLSLNFLKTSQWDESP